MAMTPSQMVPLGTPAPDFALPSVSGKTVTLSDYHQTKVLVVVFMCNHCPFVKHLSRALVEFDEGYCASGVALVGINSNDAASYPDDAFEKMVEEAEKQGYRFQYLFDESQEVAKAYKATCTPDFFVFDGKRQLVYRGQFDESRPGNGKPITGTDLREAVDAVLAGKPVTTEQKPSIGCNIKWKKGNEPSSLSKG